MTEADVIVPCTAEERAGLRRSWMLHLSVLAGLVTLLGALNADIIVAAVRVWWVSPTYSHCFLIIPVAAYLVWRRRARLAIMRPTAFPRAFLLALPVICVWALGALASINEVQQLAFVAMVQILMLSVLGPQVYRQILFPALFLFFLVPMGEYLIGPLQRFTTLFIGAGLSLLGILHHTEVNTIDLVNGRFEVAEACAGLRFLIATIAIGVLFVHFTYRKWHKITIYLLASVIVPVIGNGFRALGIVLLAYWSDNRIAVGADHIIYGWGFSVAILFVLMVIGMRFADPIPEDSDEAGIVVAPPQPRSAFVLAALAGLLAVVTVPGFVFWHDHKPLVLNRSALKAPVLADGWTRTGTTGTWAPDYAAPEAKLEFGMHRTGPFAPVVDVFVKYYAHNGSGQGLISSTNKLWNEDVWHPLAQGHTTVELGGVPVKFGELEIAAPGRSQLIWWTYWINGHFTTSAMTIKLNRLRSAFSPHDGSALIAIATPVDVDEGTANARLRAAAEALGGLRAHLLATAGLAAAQN